ncbi:RNA polymerase sigma factor [Filimonas effusa]|uniref:RNA polymerase sigma factor n=1 Tax=Filimonas effusa TaxID=2508721 RepID=UPI0013E96EC1|nr:sigma-70 family RNA polymerase sigma factor [Filimonas effusa]
MRKEDSTLWNEFLNGNRESFEAIYALYHKNLYEYGMRKADDEDLVKDCIQDLFVRLWTKRNSISATTNIKYYLMAALKNLLLNSDIRKARTPVVELEENAFFKMNFVEQELPPSRQPDEQTIRLMAALNQLTGRQKEVLYLRYFEEMDYEQIAQLMDISVKGIYKLNYRAIDALKEILNLPKNDILVLLAVCRLYFMK